MESSRVEMMTDGFKYRAENVALEAKPKRIVKVSYSKGCSCLMLST